MIIKLNQLLVDIIVNRFLKGQKKFPCHYPFSLPFFDLPQNIKKHSLFRGLAVSYKKNDTIVGPASETAKYTITQLLITLLLMYLIDLHALLRQAPNHHHIPFEPQLSFLLSSAELFCLFLGCLFMWVGFGLFPDLSFGVERSIEGSG